MSLLKTAPPAPVRSLDEILAIAHAMERDHAARYADLADRARNEGVPELAELFSRLAEDERSHENNIAGWSQQRSGHMPDPAAIPWPLPETFDEESAGELAVSKLASAYRILSMAVRNEERSFTFWSYIAADAETPEIAAAAERIAREELEHIALLRTARRRAYHAEHAGRPTPRPRSIADRWAEAALLENRLASQIDALAERLGEPGRARARELADDSRAMAAEVAAMTAGADGATTETGDAAATAERLVEDYLDIGDFARDESVALTAQSLAKRAISRLAWLRALAAETPRAAGAAGEHDRG